MHSSREKTLWTIAILGFVLGLAAGVQGMLSSRKTAAQAQARLELKLRELAECEAAVPALTAENSAAIEQDLSRVRQVLTALQAGFETPSAAGEWQNRPLPPTRTDAFFDLATFIEDARRVADQAGVALKPDERFGFASYAAEGPAPELIPAVFRQRLVTQQFVEMLFAARPHRLVSIQRELPVVAPSGAPVTGGNRPPAISPDRLPPDFFAFDPHLSARAPDAPDAMAFRLAFLGSTGTLRAFLNRLAGFALPARVRGVEVEPAAMNELASADQGSRPGSVLLGVKSTDETMVPVVVPALLKFVVTIEVIGFAPATKPASVEIVPQPSM